MKYMGSKSRVAKHLVPLLQGLIDKNNITTYVEPFVGGANIIDKIQCTHRIAGDQQKHLIALYKNLDKVESLPEYISREHYAEVKNCFRADSGIFPDWYVGAVGFLASYNGRFFDGGYSGTVKTATGVIRNYYQEARRNLESQIPKLRGVDFVLGDYRLTCSHFENALIYCDPPYFGTAQYSGREFYHEEFWDWCRLMSENNIVVVSEHSAREDFVCVWEHPVTRTLDNKKRKNAVERLFCYYEAAEALFPKIFGEEEDSWML